MLDWLARLRRDPPIEAAGPDGIALLVGLGNPGTKYRHTRHNLGFMVLDHLGERRHFRIDRKFRRALTGSWEIEGRRLVAAEPQTFMNASGESVAAIASFYKILPSQVLVVCDDISLPFGRIRLRRSGSEAGHNGLRSISKCLGTREYPRLRVGIGKPGEGRSQVEYVLAEFTRQEAAELPDILDRAADAVEAVLQDGMDAAMSRFNG